ncbi:Uncharacterised protein [Mycobacteroides abscessus]|nr:Uncharacterised protein [Mycobacteroides abscessus]
MRSHRASASSPHARPSAAEPIGSTGSPPSAASWRAAPSAVPESPAAGWTQTSSNGDSRQTREFATQFSAVPPAMVSTRSPVCPWSHVARSTSTSSSRACTDAARSACSARPPCAVPHVPSSVRRGAQRSQSGTSATKPPSPVA